MVAAVGDEQEAFIENLVAFAHEYAQQVRTDHGLFVEAFRAGRIRGVEST